MSATEGDTADESISLWTIFLTFLRIGLMSFGGGLFGLIYRDIVTKRGWLTADEFFSGMALAQILPGTNVSNLTVVIGQRLRGLPGAAVALCGLLIGPFFAVLAFYYAFGWISKWGWTLDALEGVAAAAVGFLLSVAFASAQRTRRHLPGLAVFFATFVAVGLLRWPLVPVVVGLAVPSVIAAAMKKRV